MWNANGVNIFTALTARMDALRQTQAEHAATLAKTSPDVAGLQEAVYAFSRVREQHERCSALRDRLSMARFDKKNLYSVVQEDLGELHTAVMCYCSGMGENPREHPQFDYRNAAIEALQDQHKFLVGFTETPPAETA